MKLNIQLFADGTVVIEANLDTKAFDRQIKYIEERMLEIEHQLEMADKGFEVGDTLKLEAEYEKLGNQLTSLIKKREDLNNVGIKEINTHLNEVGNSLSSIVTKVGKWALAVFSVRSAYSFVRSAISELAQTDDGLATRIEYVRWALANTLKPLIDWLVNAVYKILSLFGGLIKLITGINIFSKATAGNFEKSQIEANKLKQTTGGIRKNTSAIKKDLYGWDEMTRVTESSGLLGGAGGYGGGFGLSDDVLNAIKNLKDLGTEVDSMAKKIKNWFLGGYPDLKTALKKAPKDIWNFYKETLKPVFQKIVEPYLVKPLKEWALNTEPLWRPIKNAFENTIKDMKPIWKDFVSIVEPNVINPIKKSFSDFKTNFLKSFAPFINKIIDDINYAFGVFGVNLKHIDEDVDTTSEDIVSKIGGSLKDVIDDTKGLKKEISKVPKTYTTTFEFRGNTKDVRSKLRNLIGDIGRAGIDGALGIADYLKSMKIIGAKKGAIINMPGRGVPISSVVGGEAGKEGVIPLTDSQQMALLGEAIGKYVTINANITNNMNGRIISRELQKINAENSFASNR